MNEFYIHFGNRRNLVYGIGRTRRNLPKLIYISKIKRKRVKTLWEAQCIKIEGDRSSKYDFPDLPLKESISVGDALEKIYFTIPYIVRMIDREHAKSKWAWFIKIYTSKEFGNLTAEEKDKIIKLLITTK